MYYIQSLFSIQHSRQCLSEVTQMRRAELHPIIIIILSEVAIEVEGLEGQPKRSA